MTAMGYALLALTRSSRRTSKGTPNVNSIACGLRAGDRLHRSSIGQISPHLVVVITNQVAQSSYGAAGQHHSLQLTRVSDGTHGEVLRGSRRQKIFQQMSRLHYRGPQ